MHRLRISTLAALILVSQVVCLAVVSTAVWELHDLHSRVTQGLDQTSDKPPPDSLKKSGPAEEHQFRAPRFLGKSGLFSECVSMQLRVRVHHELAGSIPPGPKECEPGNTAD